MKYFYLLIISFLALTSAEAQTRFEVDTNVVLTTFDHTANDPIGHGLVCNTSSETIFLMWRIERVSVPIGWENYMCDDNNCYWIDTQECPEDNPVDLVPGQCSILDLHIIFGGITECGIYKVTVWEQGDTLNTAEITYKFNCTTSSTDQSWAESIRIFPNPVAQSFTLNETEGIAHLELYTLLGKQVGQYKVAQGKHYDVSDLNAGVYVVSLFDENNGQIRSLRIKKD